MYLAKFGLPPCPWGSLSSDGNQTAKSRSASSGRARRGRRRVGLRRPRTVDFEKVHFRNFENFGAPCAPAQNRRVDALKISTRLELSLRLATGNSIPTRMMWPMLTVVATTAILQQRVQRKYEKRNVNNMTLSMDKYKNTSTLYKQRDANRQAWQN